MRVLIVNTSEKTGGNVRKDFPGDGHNAFTSEGRTRAENAMFNWTSRLLKWCNGNDGIMKGTKTQFIPVKGVYVIARQHAGKTVLTVLNGTSKPAVMPVKRYAEVIGSTTPVRDVLSGRKYDLSNDVQLRPRQTLVLEFRFPLIH